MKILLLVISIFLAFCLACDGEPTSSLTSGSDHDPIGIYQGIYGTVLFWEGDFMPTYPENGTNGDIYPVVRDVCIFERVLYDDVDWAYVEVEPGISALLAIDIPAPLVRVVHSNEKGYFETSLPPGLYSIFVKEGRHFYANRVDMGGYVFPAEVRKGEATGVQFDITYMATY